MKDKNNLEFKFKLPEDYKFVYKIQDYEYKLDFDTNTIVDKILITRTKKVDEEVIKQLRNIGEENNINELVLIDESKVLKIIKSLKALEIIMNKQVHLELLKISEGLEDYEFMVDECYNKVLIQEEYDLLKEVIE